MRECQKVPPVSLVSGAIALLCLAAVALPASAQQAVPWWDWASEYWDTKAQEQVQPHFYLSYALGDSSGDPEELQLGHHDPTREDGTVQSLELGLSLRANEYIHGFATYNLGYGAEEEWEGEWEEAFVKLIYPDIAHIRGGRMLTRFGDLNAKHLHGWDTVDIPLVLGRFLGDDGLIIDGGDVTGTLTTGQLTTSLVLGYGDRPSHDDHGHSEEEAHGEEHEGEEHEEEGGHAHGGEEALPQDEIGTARLFFRYLPNDFWRYVFGVNGVMGDTEEGLDSGVFGLDFSLTWRENGLETGGRGVRWTTEWLYREFDGEAPHEEEHEEEHDGEHAHEEEESETREYNEAGIYSTLVYTHNVHFDAGLRLGWVGGIPELELEERFRVSPLLSYFIDESRFYHVRVQYNYDDLEESEEHSVWLQFQVAFGGGAEVR